MTFRSVRNLRRFILLWLVSYIFFRHLRLLRCSARALFPTITSIEETTTITESDANNTTASSERTVLLYNNTMNQTNSSQRCCSPRKSQWTLTKNANAGSTGGPATRLLIAQYSAFGSYAKLLEMTVPITKLYGKKWNHDVLVVQGVTINEFHTNDAYPQKRCTMLDQSNNLAMYNKMPILMRAFEKGYDQVLLLDADALIYNLEFDIQQMLFDNTSSSNVLLVAHKADNNNNNATTSSSSSSNNTWNINNGVTLWNLKHKQFKFTLQTWVKYTLQDLQQGGTIRHGDQSYLHRVLKRHDLQRFVHALNTSEFQYRKGTVIKHFPRRNQRVWNDFKMDDRLQEIENAVHEVCIRNTSNCEAMERIPYSTFASCIIYDSRR
eukprot:scaffold1060_cov109-Cylindrotheca_fusiformis.AAC.5